MKVFLSLKLIFLRCLFLDKFGRNELSSCAVHIEMRTQLSLAFSNYLLINIVTMSDSYAVPT